MQICELDIFAIVSFWTTARLVHFSPMFFELVRAVFATIGFDLSTCFSICRAEIRASSAGPAIHFGYKEFHFRSLLLFLFRLVIFVMDVSD